MQSLIVLLEWLWARADAGQLRINDLMQKRSKQLQARLLLVACAILVRGTKKKPIHRLPVVVFPLLRLLLLLPHSHPRHRGCHSQ